MLSPKQLWVSLTICVHIKDKTLQSLLYTSINKITDSWKGSNRLKKPLWVKETWLTFSSSLAKAEFGIKRGLNQGVKLGARGPDASRASHAHPRFSEGKVAIRHVMTTWLWEFDTPTLNYYLAGQSRKGQCFLLVGTWRWQPPKSWSLWFYIPSYSFAQL